MTSAIAATAADQASSMGGTTAPPNSADAAAFGSAVAASPGGALTVSGNTIDTGRYIITASTNYTQPSAMGGASAGDGMLTVEDTKTGSSVEVFGDPHLYTSAGDEADFQQDGLTINLGDGTTVQFDPTAVSNGVAHIQAVAVTKGDETVTQTGFDTGAIQTSAVTQGGASTSQGFNNVDDTVLSAAPDGSLGTLTNTMGATLQSTDYQESLDGMGGGYSQFASSSGMQAMQQYGATMAQNAGGNGGVNAAAEPQSGSTTAPAAAPSSVGSGGETALLQQVIGLLQQQLGASTGQQPASGTPAAAGQGGAAQGAQPDASAAQPGSTQPVAAASGEAGALQELISLLQQLLGGSNNGGQALSSQESSLIGQLLPALQKQLDSLTGGTTHAAGSSGETSSAAGGATSTSDLMSELLSSLQTQVSGAQAGSQPSAVPASYNPAMGISGAEITQMLANANGTAPAIDYSAWDQAATNFAQAQSESSPNAAGQVSNLSSQTGSEAT